MEIIKSKRGRPATGRRMDGTLYLRLPNDKKEEVRRLVREFLGRREPEKVDVPLGMALNGGVLSPSGGEIEDLKKKLMAAVDESAALRDEVLSLQVQLDKEKNMGYDEKMASLLFRCKKAEEYAASKNDGNNWGA
jgi:hypothetical protein